MSGLNLDDFDRAAREAAEGLPETAPAEADSPSASVPLAAATRTASDARLAKPAPSPAPAGGFANTDCGNAEHFAAHYGPRLRFDHRRQRWLLFRDHHWHEDDAGGVYRVAKAAIRRRQKEALGLTSGGDRQDAIKWAVRSESRNRIEALLALARSERRIADRGDGWDADPRLLGVPNGVVDLRTGTLRDGRSEDRITLVAGAPFDPKATAPRWEAFLSEVMSGDEGMLSYLHRIAGYCLTGLTLEQVLFVNIGRGANGKTVFLNILRAAAGDYAHNLPFSALELDARSAIPADIAQLPGKRLVTASETNDGARLNEARVKALTGCDPMTAAAKYRDPFTFQPVAKLLLAANFPPVVRDDSEGFWRRVRRIPWNRRFAEDEADPNLEETLRGELPGILAWMVRGAVLWGVEGLRTPDSVRRATEDYREASDPLADFLGAATVPDPAAWTRASDLYRAYLKWADGQGLRDKERLSSRRFGERMRTKYEKKKSGGVVFYLGVRLPDGRSGEGREGQPSPSGTSRESLPRGEVSGNGSSTLPPSPDEAAAVASRRTPPECGFPSGVAHRGPSKSNPESKGHSGAVESPPFAMPSSDSSERQALATPPPAASNTDGWTAAATADDRTRLADLRPFPPTERPNP